MIKSCKEHRANHVISKLPKKELEFLGIADNDLRAVKALIKDDGVIRCNWKTAEY